MTRLDPPWVVDVGGGRWSLIHPRKNAEPVQCQMCGNAIRRTARRYRCRDYAGQPVVFMHQKCLLGQVDPTVWDIG